MLVEQPKRASGIEVDGRLVKKRSITITSTASLSTSTKREDRTLGPFKRAS